MAAPRRAPVGEFRVRERLAEVTGPRVGRGARPIKSISVSDVEVAREVERCMAKLFLILPFYSIESWAYQNTEKGTQICHKNHNGKHLEPLDQLDQLDLWAQDRTALDNVKNLKDAFASCLGSRHNHDLATRNFPAQAVYDAKRSFARVVDQLGASDALLSVLKRTHSEPAWSDANRARLVPER